MTDDRDDETAGVPVRSERVDSGAHVTESGRHVTNRNVVPRGDSGLLRRPTAPDVPPDAFDSVTPVLPVPLEAPSRDSFDVITPIQPPPQAVDSFDAMTPPPPAAPLGDDPALGNTAPGPSPRAGERGPEAAPVAPAHGLPASRRTPTGFLPGMQMPRAGADLIARIPALRVGGAEGPAAGTPPTSAASEAASRATDPAGAAASPAPEPSPRRSPVRAASHGAHAVASPPPHAASDGVPAAPDPRRGSGRVASEGTPATPDPRQGSGRVASDGVPEPRHGAGRAASPPAGIRGGRAASEHASEQDRLATERTRKPRPVSEYAHAPVALDRALRVVAIVAVFGLGAAGLAQPTSVLRGGIAWLAFLFFVLAGWGTIVVRVARTADPDAGQRIALGIAGYLAVAGPLLALGILSRPVLLFLICIGFAGFAWREATARLALWHRIRDGLLAVRGNPAIGALVVAVVVLAAIRLVGAVAALDRNPWDDDVAYTPLVKRLLDAGDLIEPFSFRRLGAYGGQSVLQALGAARGSLSNIHLIDRGLGLGTVLLLAVGYARERRTEPLWLALVALVLLLLPETAINTASYWTGVVGFFALYRCIVREQWALVGLVGAATCTLRQNYLVIVVLFVAILLLGRLVTLARTMPRREAWAQERHVWAWIGGVALAMIVPWWIASFLSSHTFLFPMLDGTWNHALSLRPPAVTLAQELAYLIATCLESPPLVVIPLLAVVVAFTRDHRLGRPLSALVIASAVGLALLCHSFVGAESSNLWRYEFGAAATLLIVLGLELGAADDSHVALAPLGRWIVLAAFGLQIVVGRSAIPKQMVALFDDVREASALDRHGDPAARVEQRRYTAMQAAIPAGARVLVMLDDPAMLDYRRNRIASLDTPAYASPGAQLPTFRGAEPLRAYLVAEGYRYVAFVRSDRSHYFFHRGSWVARLFTDIEIYQIMGAYTVDAIDNLAELATTTPRLYDSDGLVVLDLAHPQRAASTRPSTGDEATRRSAWVKELADREGVHDAWSLATRADLRFEDGAGQLRFVDGAIDDPRWYDVTHPRAAPAARGTAILPMQRRVHLRVRGATDMRLRLRAAVALGSVFTHPRLDVSLDGELIGSAIADPAGKYQIEALVPRARLAGGWHDVYLVFSSVAEPERDIRDVRIARLESVEWTPP